MIELYAASAFAVVVSSFYFSYLFIKTEAVTEKKHTARIFSFLLSLFASPNIRGERKCAALTFFVVGIWALGRFFLVFSTSETMAVNCIKLSYSGSIFIPVSYLMFVFKVVDKKLNQPLFALLWFISFALFLANLSGDIVHEAKPKIWFDYYDVPGKYFNVFSSFHTTITLIIYWVLFSSYKRSSGKKKTQIGYVLLTTFLGFAGSATTFPLVHNIAVYPFGMPLVSLYPLAIFYVTTKYELIDMKVVVTRLSSYLFVFFLFSISMFIAVYSVTDIYQKFSLVLLFGYAWLLWGQRFREKIQTGAERKWLTDWYDEHAVIAKISDRLSALFDRRQIIETVAEELKNIMVIPKVYLCIAQTDKNGNISQYLIKESSALEEQVLDINHPLIHHLHKEKLYTPVFSRDLANTIQQTIRFIHSHSLLLPLYSPEALEGIVILGVRESEKPYEKKDLQTLTTLMRHISVFLDRMRPYEKIQQEFNDTQRQLFESERQLIRSEKIASTTNLIREYNHEIKTPLQVLMGDVELLKEDFTPEQIRKFKEKAIKCIHKIDDIVKTTLRLSNTAQPRIEEEIDINKIIKQALTVSASNIKVIQDLSELPHIIGDESDIERVIINLIANASAAMPNGGELKVTTSQEGNHILIEISDTGVGILPKNLDKIWEPFFSTHTTKGRGLGLSIVHRIIREHQGEISCMSTPNKGSKFTIKFPNPNIT